LRSVSGSTLPPNVEAPTKRYSQRRILAGMLCCPLGTQAAGSATVTLTAWPRFCSRRPGPLPQRRAALPRRPGRRLRVYALRLLAGRHLPGTGHRLRAGPRLGHESRPRQQDQVRPPRRPGHRPPAQGRQLPAGLRLPPVTSARAARWRDAPSGAARRPRRGPDRLNSRRAPGRPESCPGFARSAS
jgi:hypothetical protein